MEALDALLTRVSHARLSDPAPSPNGSTGCSGSPCVPRTTGNCGPGASSW